MEHSTMKMVGTMFSAQSSRHLHEARYSGRAPHRARTEPMASLRGHDDAGPNVKVLTTPDDEASVQQALPNTFYGPSLAGVPRPFNDDHSGTWKTDAGSEYVLDGTRYRTCRRPGRSPRYFRGRLPPNRDTRRQ